MEPRPAADRPSNLALVGVLEDLDPAAPAAPPPPSSWMEWDEGFPPRPHERVRKRLLAVMNRTKGAAVASTNTTAVPTTPTPTATQQTDPGTTGTPSSPSLTQAVEKVYQGSVRNARAGIQTRQREELSSLRIYDELMSPGAFLQQRALPPRNMLKKLREKTSLRSLRSKISSSSLHPLSFPSSRPATPAQEGPSLGADVPPVPRIPRRYALEATARPAPTERRSLDLPVEGPSWDQEVAAVRERVQSDREKECRERIAAGKAEKKVLRAFSREQEGSSKIQRAKGALKTLLKKTEELSWLPKEDPRAFTEEDWEFVDRVLDHGDTRALRDRLYKRPEWLEADRARQERLRQNPTPKYLAARKAEEDKARKEYGHRKQLGMLTAEEQEQERREAVGLGITTTQPSSSQATVESPESTSVTWSSQDSYGPQYSGKGKGPMRPEHEETPSRRGNRDYGLQARARESVEQMTGVFNPAFNPRLSRLGSAEVKEFIRNKSSERLASPAPPPIASLDPRQGPATPSRVRDDQIPPVPRLPPALDLANATNLTLTQSRSPPSHSPFSAQVQAALARSPRPPPSGVHPALRGLASPPTPASAPVGAHTFPSAHVGAQPSTSAQVGAYTIPSAQVGAQLSSSAQVGAHTIPSAHVGAQLSTSAPVGASTPTSAQVGVPSTTTSARAGAHTSRIPVLRKARSSITRSSITPSTFTPPAFPPLRPLPLNVRRQVVAAPPNTATQQGSAPNPPPRPSEPSTAVKSPRESQTSPSPSSPPRPTEARVPKTAPLIRKRSTSVKTPMAQGRSAGTPMPSSPFPSLHADISKAEISNVAPQQPAERSPTPTIPMSATGGLPYYGALQPTVRSPSPPIIMSSTGGLPSSSTNSQQFSRNVILSSPITEPMPTFPIIGPDTTGPPTPNFPIVGPASSVPSFQEFTRNVPPVMPTTELIPPTPRSPLSGLPSYSTDFQQLSRNVVMPSPTAEPTPRSRARMSSIFQDFPDASAFSAISAFSYDPRARRLPELPGDRLAVPGQDFNIPPMPNRPPPNPPRRRTPSPLRGVTPRDRLTAKRSGIPVAPGSDVHTQDLKAVGPGTSPSLILQPKSSKSREDLTRHNTPKGLYSGESSDSYSTLATPTPGYSAKGRGNAPAQPLQPFTSASPSSTRQRARPPIPARNPLRDLPGLPLQAPATVPGSSFEAYAPMSQLQAPRTASGFSPQTRALYQSSLGPMMDPFSAQARSSSLPLQTSHTASGVQHTGNVPESSSQDLTSVRTASGVQQAGNVPESSSQDLTSVQSSTDSERPPALPPKDPTTPTGLLARAKGRLLPSRLPLASGVRAMKSRFDLGKSTTDVSSTPGHQAATSVKEDHMKQGKPHRSEQPESLGKILRRHARSIGDFHASPNTPSVQAPSIPPMPSRAIIAQQMEKYMADAAPSRPSGETSVSTNNPALPTQDSQQQQSILATQMFDTPSSRVAGHRSVSDNMPTPSRGQPLTPGGRSLSHGIMGATEQAARHRGMVIDAASPAALFSRPGAAAQGSASAPLRQGRFEPITPTAAPVDEEENLYDVTPPRRIRNRMRRAFQASPSDHPMDISIQDQINMWQQSSPDPARESQHSERSGDSKKSKHSEHSDHSQHSVHSFQSQGTQMLRSQVGLEPIREHIPGEQRHPNHHYNWDTKKVMCRRIHNPGFTLPALPSTPLGESANMAEIEASYFVGTPYTAITAPERCAKCGNFCCKYAELENQSQARSTDVNAYEPGQRNRAEELIATMRVTKPNGVEEWDALLECAQCKRRFCPECIMLCAEKLCQEPVCLECRDGTELCRLHNMF